MKAALIIILIIGVLIAALCALSTAGPVDAGVDIPAEYPNFDYDHPTPGSQREIMATRGAW